MRSLTKKQQLFVKHYKQVLNGAKAARLAGYPDKTARQVSYELMRKPHIKRLFDEWRLEMDREWKARREQQYQHLSIPPYNY